MHRFIQCKIFFCEDAQRLHITELPLQFRFLYRNKRREYLLLGNF